MTQALRCHLKSRVLPVLDVVRTEMQDSDGGFMAMYTWRYDPRCGLSLDGFEAVIEIEASTLLTPDGVVAETVSPLQDFQSLDSDITGKVYSGFRSGSYLTFRGYQLAFEEHLGMQTPPNGGAPYLVTAG